MGEVDEPEAPAVEEVATETPAAEEPAVLEPAAEEAVPAEAPVEEAEVEAAPVEEVAPVEEAVADNDNDSEVTFQTTPRISSRLDVASITALMAKNEEGELSQQEFYRVFLMTVQSGLMANQLLEELESRMTAAEDKINSVEPAAAEAPVAEESPAVEEAAVEAVPVVEVAPVEEEAPVVEETAAVEEEVAAEPVEAEAEAAVEEPPKETEAAEELMAEVEEEKTEEVDISTLVAVAEKMRPSRKRAQASQGGRVSQSASRAKRQRRVR